MIVVLLFRESFHPLPLLFHLFEIYIFTDILISTHIQIFILQAIIITFCYAAQTHTNICQSSGMMNPLASLEVFNQTHGLNKILSKLFYEYHLLCWQIWTRTLMDHISLGNISETPRVRHLVSYVRTISTAHVQNEWVSIYTHTQRLVIVWLFSRTTQCQRHSSPYSNRLSSSTNLNNLCFVLRHLIFSNPLFVLYNLFATGKNCANYIASLARALNMRI